MNDYPAIARLLMGLQPPPSKRVPYSGEAEYFRQNPNVAGMAAEDGKVVLNPRSRGLLGDVVAQNESFRHRLNQSPSFPVTEKQKQFFAGTPYASDPAAMRQTIAARIASGDPSANATPEQIEWVKRFLMRK